MTEWERLIESIKDISGALLPAQNEADEITLTHRWYLGKTIMESTVYKRDKVHIVTQLARILKCSKVTLYREIRFYEMFPNLETAPGILDFSSVEAKLPEGKKLSWYIVANRVLCKEQEEQRCRIAISLRASLAETVDRIRERKCRIVTLHEPTGKRIETIEII